MALPKINALPKYELKVPSTGETVRYRPFLVKEEKVLMMAMESGEPRAALNAIFDTVNACVHEKTFTKKELIPADVEYMFLQIRAKSVGETSKVMMKCSSCETSNEVTINLQEVKVTGKEADPVIKLTDDISVKMKHPSFSDIVDSGITPENANNIDMIFKLIAKAMESVMTEDENVLVADQPESEIIDFLESLNTQQFTKIKEYIESVPQVRYHLEFTCSSCGHDNQREITGIANFFS